MIGYVRPEQEIYQQLVINLTESQCGKSSESRHIIQSFEWLT
jgi:hypothetical protein